MTLTATTSRKKKLTTKKKKKKSKRKRKRKKKKKKKMAKTTLIKMHGYILIVQPIDGTDTATATATASDEGAAPYTLAIITAFNDKHGQFAAVTQVWATDAIIAAFNGVYTEYDTFAAIPRPLKAAPDATTWAGVQLWLWWLPPTSFAAGSGDTRTVCTSRTGTIWNTMASAYRASEVLEVLPDLEPELWELIFTFLRHDRQPAYLCR